MNKKTSVEVTQKHTDKQKDFLRLAVQAGVKEEVFGRIVPEIQFEEQNFQTDRPTVAYVHTGGTLMMVPSKTHKNALSFDGAVQIEKVIEVLDFLYNIRNKYNLIGIHVDNADSKDISPEHWTSIAATIKTMYMRINGVVVGHGTHTLADSAAACAFALRNLAIPIIYTASQIPILGTEGSDGIQNLSGSFYIAGKGDFGEVMAYSNGTLHRAVRVQKEEDSRLNIFASKVVHPIGYFGAGPDGGAFAERMAGAKPRNAHEKYELAFQPEFARSVTVLRNVPAMSKMALEGMIEAGKANGDIGIIIETFGSGALQKELVNILAKQINKGYPVIVTSSCGGSGMSAHMQGHDEDAIEAERQGLIFVGDMLTSVAAVKLQSVYQAASSEGLSGREFQSEIKRRMKKSYAGELSKPVRSDHVDF